MKMGSVAEANGKTWFNAVAMLAAHRHLACLMVDQWPT
ncbi:hypothetical protein CPter91_0318 [Collimonas pratensis]|uniref:Uncharacterized protein n=1 Tax=Collimonas pratensis TaxID=279113 RepID=A0A127PY45_9BURK|nr:hypothetical protein CPter91_0318 [Collimonas pratensis]